ncbi:MAG: SAM-dependent methyltransferase [Alphaproteobacteria bacterium]|nr:MAG: SAM-dependent methyltransferase [Alphaproteobacteria bacterium]
MSENGWETSAAAWIADMGEHGDFGRRYVLDPIMLPRALARAPKNALDVGCGEGRFCRMLGAHGIAATGVDPTAALIAHARTADIQGTYLEAPAEQLPFEDASFDLVVSYLALIDIPDYRAGIAEMARVLKPGGTLLIASLNGFNTAGAEMGWLRDARGELLCYPVDYYLDERAFWTEWRGIRIVNHHRPLQAYMKALVCEGLQLTHFEEPAPIEGAPEPKAERYRRSPWFLVMEWVKPR